MKGSVMLLDLPGLVAGAGRKLGLPPQVFDMDGKKWPDVVL
jgi:hypothetical protein